MSKFLIIDTSYLAYRSYFAFPRLTNSEGVNTGAIFGFAKTIFQITNKLDPDFIVFTKDRIEPTFRHSQIENYKGGRAPMEDNMVSQLPLIEEFSNFVTPNNFSVLSFEADDIIYSVVNQYSKDDNQFYIYSGDKDLYQLFTYDNVCFIKEEREFVTMFTVDDFRTKYELQPQQWVDYKALIGDNSDNFAGVDGVGPVTATKILKGCGSLFNLIGQLGLDNSSFSNFSIEDNSKEFVNDSKNAKTIDKVRTHFEQLKLSYKLSKLASCDYSDKALDPSYDFEKTLPLLKKLDMNQLVKYYNTNFGQRLIQDELF
jgi:DNA polymerase I